MKSTTETGVVHTHGLVQVSNCAYVLNTTVITENCRKCLFVCCMHNVTLSVTCVNAEYAQRYVSVGCDFFFFCMLKYKNICSTTGLLNSSAKDSTVCSYPMLRM